MKKNTYTLGDLIKKKQAIEKIHLPSMYERLLKTEVNKAELNEVTGILEDIVSKEEELIIIKMAVNLLNSGITQNLNDYISNANYKDIFKLDLVTRRKRKLIELLKASKESIGNALITRISKFRNKNMFSSKRLKEMIANLTTVETDLRTKLTKYNENTTVTLLI